MPTLTRTQPDPTWVGANLSESSFDQATRTGYSQEELVFLAVSFNSLMESSVDDLDSWKADLSSRNSTGSNNRVIEALDWHKEVKTLLPELKTLEERKQGWQPEDRILIEKAIALDKKRDQNALLAYSDELKEMIETYVKAELDQAYSDVRFNLFDGLQQGDSLKKIERLFNAAELCQKNHPHLMQSETFDALIQGVFEQGSQYLGILDKVQMNELERQGSYDALRAMSDFIAGAAARQQLPSAEFYSPTERDRDRAKATNLGPAAGADTRVALDARQFPAALMHHTQTLGALEPEKREWVRNQRAPEIVRNLCETFSIPGKEVLPSDAHFLLTKSILPKDTDGEITVPRAKIGQPNSGMIRLDSAIPSFSEFEHILVHELLHATPRPKATEDQLLIGFSYEQNKSQVIFEDFEEATVESLTVIARLMDERAPRAEFNTAEDWRIARLDLLEDIDLVRQQPHEYPGQVKALLDLFEAAPRENRPYLWGALLDARTTEGDDLTLEELAICRVETFLDAYNSLVPEESMLIYKEKTQMFKYDDEAQAFRDDDDRYQPANPDNV